MKQPMYCFFKTMAKFNPPRTKFFLDRMVFNIIECLENKKDLQERWKIIWLSYGGNERPISTQL